jgi:hypothetical protein
VRCTTHMKPHVYITFVKQNGFKPMRKKTVFGTHLDTSYKENSNKMYVTCNFSTKRSLWYINHIYIFILFIVKTF